MSLDFSAITDDLFIGSSPSRADYDRLRDQGVRLVINMRLERPPFRDQHKPPLKFIWLPTIDSPALVIPIRFLVNGTRTALEKVLGATRCADTQRRS